jgi:hypothetical protein
VRFASFLSGEFITFIVVNPKKKWQSAWADVMKKQNLRNI